MDVYEIMLNNNNFDNFNLNDFKNIKVSCKVKNAVSLKGNIKRFFYKVILNDYEFNYDLDKHYNLMELLSIVKNDIEYSLPF